MEQPKTQELARVRAWLESLRQDPAHTAAGAPFTLGPGVIPLYGAVLGAPLKDHSALLQYIIAFTVAKPRELFKVPEDFDDEIHAAQRAEIESFESRQAPFLTLLDAVVADHEQAAVRFLPAVKKLLDTHVWSLPTMGGSAHHHDIVNDDSGLYAYVAMLLLDQGYGRELRRCENCRNPFLVRPTAGRGRPQKRFCSKGCATDTHDSKSGERRRRARAIGLLERKYGRAKSRDAVRRAFDLHPEVNVKALAAQAKALLSQGARKHK